jgi:alkylation response protein AidB-like acyl-CoA dehydrogenase
MAKTFSRRNLDFTLYEVLNVEELTQHAYFSDHNRETFGFIFDAFTEMAEKILHPQYAASDRAQPDLVDGQVKVHPVIHEFLKTFNEAGFMAAPFPAEFGGIQLPKVVAAAAEFVLGSANNAATMYTDLTKGAANLIYTFGSDAQKAYFLPKMLSGEWLGTMCLTETQAGSSLSDITTSATPQADGTYKIKGQKIFISAGDHDVTDNIVHLVLARIDGAPKGTKGISLFAVTKMRDDSYSKLENTEGGVLASNDVASIGIYHKMGQKATPAMHLEFGAKGDCIGHLIGAENRGLPQMFLMMNGARLGVGLAGIHIASAAYYASLQYAHERPQGRRITEKNALSEPTTIIYHADIRRMLFLQKAIFEGGLSLILQCFKYLDLEKLQKGDEKDRISGLLELLTPVAKTYGAEMGFQSVSNGLQVFGGYGYTEDFPLEQLLRDSRIMSLYEGTTGIQSLALLGREVAGRQGRSLVDWYNEVAKDVHPAEKMDALKPYWDKLMEAMRLWQKVNAHVLGIAQKGDTEVFLADANLYMEAFGILNVAWQWLKHGIVAQKAVEKGAQDDDLTFYQSKIQTMRFYFHYELPKLKGLSERLMDETVLTIFDDDGAELLV